MQKLDFNSGWYFRRCNNIWFLDKDDGAPVTLPHDAQIHEPRSADYETGTGGGFFKNGNYLYTKRFQAEESWKNSSVVLELEGVYQWAEVNLNGNLLATQPYGYSSFLVDLTGKLRYDRENVLTVAANNSAVPNSRWYSGAGMYRPVWLRVGGAVAVAPWGVQVSTPVASPSSSTVRVEAEVTNRSGSAAQAQIRFVIKDEEGNQAAAGEQSLSVEKDSCAKAAGELTVSPAKLWSLEQPYLYTLETTVTVDGKETDRAETTFGIRKVEVDPENGFRLNGVPIKLKGGCIHHDNGLLGSASFPRSEERKVELMLSAGFNMIRCAHNPPAPSMLDACDRLGMLVMDETFDCWRMGKNPNDYHLFFEDWWDRDTTAMVKRDFNHPSVVMWSIGNEITERDGSSDGYEWCRKQAELVRSLDPSRPITSALNGLFEHEDDTGDNLMANLVAGTVNKENDRWGDLTEPYAASLDVVGYNYLFHRYEHDHERFPKRVIAGTETFPSQQFDYWMATIRNNHVIGDFVWTSIDYLGEAGIGRADYDAELSFSGPYPWHQAFCGDFDLCGFKRPQSYYRDILWGVRDIPYIATHHPDNYGKKVVMSPWGWNPVAERWDYPGCEGKMLTVEVYSDQEEVELLLNGQSLGRKPAGNANRNTACFDVAYQPGELVAVAYSGGKETGRFQLTSAGKAAKLRITADREQISGKHGDLAYLTVEVLDSQDRLVAYADNAVTFAVEGDGELQAVGNGNPKSDEDYTGITRRAHCGKLMAVVKSTGQPGAIRVKAEAPGLEGAEVTVKLV